MGFLAACFFKEALEALGSQPLALGDEGLQVGSFSEVAFDDFEHEPAIGGLVPGTEGVVGFPSRSGAGRPEVFFRENRF